MPDITPLTEPYWRALEQGRLLYQRCSICNNAWLPAREECPKCLSEQHDWVQSCGEGQLISWVVYRHATHEYFTDKVPYIVAVVELVEGPRLITSLADGTPAIDAKVRFRPAQVDGFAVTSFETVPD